MTQNWVTIVVALLAAATGLAGALGGQLIASGRARRLAEIERESRRDEADRQDRRASYARFLLATRRLGPAVRAADRAEIDRALTGLREAGADVELANPDLWDDHGASVLDGAENWAAAVLRNGPTAPDARDTQIAHSAALAELRDRMREDLGRQPSTPRLQ